MTPSELLEKWELELHKASTEFMNASAIHDQENKDFYRGKMNAIGLFIEDLEKLKEFRSKNLFKNQLIEIVVDENIPFSANDNNPKVYVNMDFGLMLRVGDVLYFNEKDKDQPKWIVKSENFELLYDFAVELTLRNIFDNNISFNGKLS